MTEPRLDPQLLPAGEPVGVAVSGGADSMLLLRATVEAARSQPGAGPVWALHVHHGLQPDADGWVQLIARCCDAWQRADGIGPHFEWVRLQTAPPAGQSVEAWAREQRYRALTQMAHGRGIRQVLLAHHRRDQAETVLLQALRGAGPEGCAAMPRRVVRSGLSWVRPWLDLPAADLREAVRRLALPHVVDPSNADPRWARNRLRQLWPGWASAFPGMEVALAQTAWACGMARDALDELARMDAVGVLGEAAEAGGGLPIEPLRQLSPARQANLVRHWWRLNVGRAPRAAFVRRLLQASAASPPSGRRIPDAAGAFALCWRGRWLVRLAEAPRASSAPSTVGRCGGPVSVELVPDRAVTVPGWGGCLRWHGSDPHPSSRSLAVAVRGRAPGDAMSLGPGRPTRPLKRQFQACDVPPDDRHGPVVALGDGRVLWVHGLGLNAPVAALVGLSGDLQWEWDPAAD